MLNKEDMSFCLSVIYGPNVDSPGFFDSTIKEAMETDSNVIVIGDYNTVLDQSLDQKSMCGRQQNPNSSNRLKDLMEENLLQDVWRARNPDVRRYSWYRSSKDSIQASRLDYTLMSIV